MSATPRVVEVEAVAPPAKDTVQITFRIPRAWLAEADEIATLLSRPGFEATRTDALRAAIARGIESLRADAKVQPKKK